MTFNAYNPKPKGESPLARVIKNYLANQVAWPPLTVKDVARLIGRSSMTTGNWVNRNTMPDLATQLDVIEKLNISVVDLVQAYDDLGWPVPALLRRMIAAAPKPKTTKPQPRPTQPLDEWQTYLAMTKDALEQAGLDQESIANVLTMLEQKHQGIQPYQQRIAEEHDESILEDEQPATGRQKKQRLTPR